MRSSCHGVAHTRSSPSRRGQRVREHERALLREPERRLVAAAAVVERDQASRQLRARLDRLELGLRDVLAPEQVRPEGAGAVAADEEVDVADVVRLQDDDERRRRASSRSQTSVALGGGASGSITRDLAAGVDARGGDRRIPADVRPPTRGARAARSRGPARCPSPRPPRPGRLSPCARSPSSAASTSGRAGGSRCRSCASCSSRRGSRPSRPTYRAATSCSRAS